MLVKAGIELSRGKASMLDLAFTAPPHDEGPTDAEVDEVNRLIEENLRPASSVGASRLRRGRRTRRNRKLRLRKPKTRRI